MRPKSSIPKKPAEQVVKDIRRATRRHFSAEDKIRIVVDAVRRELVSPNSLINRENTGNSPTDYSECLKARHQKRPRFCEFSHQEVVSCRFLSGSFPGRYREADHRNNERNTT